MSGGEVLLRICDAHKDGREGSMFAVWGDSEALSPVRIANACNSVSGLAKVLDEHRFYWYGDSDDRDSVKSRRKRRKSLCGK